MFKIFGVNVCRSPERMNEILKIVLVLLVRSDKIVIPAHLLHLFLATLRRGSSSAMFIGMPGRIMIFV
jgi:hypothetical protein